MFALYFSWAIPVWMLIMFGGLFVIMPLVCPTPFRVRRVSEIVEPGETAKALAALDRIHRNR